MTNKIREVTLIGNDGNIETQEVEFEYDGGEFKNKNETKYGPLEKKRTAIGLSIVEEDTLIPLHEELTAHKGEFFGFLQGEMVI